jgi:hypothetical protein
MLKSMWKGEKATRNFWQVKKNEEDRTLGAKLTKNRAWGDSRDPEVRERINKPLPPFEMQKGMKTLLQGRIVTKNTVMGKGNQLNLEVR